MSSRQIRPPIYSLKQTKLRKRRVIRYAILYFILLVVFLALIVGPIVAGNKFDFGLPTLPMEILQPTGFNNNDTTNTPTGVCLQTPCPKWDGASGDSTSDDSTTDNSNSDEVISDKLRRFMAY